jgi:peptidoglycan/xylan/chitin deacetylase (PgdA/CDA1 family)
MIREQNFKATFFITTDYIDKNDLYVTADNLKEIQRNGMEIGGHSLSHAFLDELDSETLSGELGNSKEKLENITGKQIEFFSCPGGRYNRRVIESASEIGYQGMCTSYPGSHIIRDGLYIFSRILIRRNTSLDEFINILNMKSSLLLKLRCADKIKTLTKKTLGNRLYYQLWSKYTKKQ